ncbi:MAG: hypothetical protein ACE5GZ_14445, partial [Gammaproteobacteria bacterium]
MKFDYKSLPWNIIFGVGEIKRLPSEMDRMNLHHALVLSTPEQKDQAQEIVELLNTRVAGVFDQAIMEYRKNKQGIPVCPVSPSV